MAKDGEEQYIRPIDLSYIMSQKTIPLTLDHNFGKCRQVLKILSSTDSQKDILYTVSTKYSVRLFIFLNNVVKN